MCPVGAYRQALNVPRPGTIKLGALLLDSYRPLGFLLLVGRGRQGGIMNKTMISLAFGASMLAVCATAQPQAQLVSAMPAGAAVLHAGTSIPLRMREAITTKGKMLKVGQRVQLEVAENITMNGQTVIPAGSPAVGEITTVRNKGMWGKSGGITGRVLYARVGDRQIRMTGNFDDKGKTGTGGVIAAVAFIPIAGFFTTGTSAAIPLGAPVGGFLDEDVPVMMAATPVAPLQAVAPAAAAPVAAVTNASLVVAK